MNVAWIGLICALSGTLVGGIVTYLVQLSHFRREKHWEWLSVQRTKFEEIGQVVEELRQYYVALAVAAFKQSKGLELNSAQLEQAVYPLARLIVLIRFYAPELEPELGAVRKQEEAVKAAFVVLVEKSRIDNGQFNTAAFNAALDVEKLFDQRCADLLDRLADEAKWLVPKGFRGTGRPVTRL